jgi:hypothetical protein
VRLNAIIRSFPARYALESICGDSMPAMLQRIALTTTGIMAAKPCVVGDALPVDALCRAADVAADGRRTAIPQCGDGDATCFELVVDEPVCGHTPSKLRANVQRPGLAPAGSRFVLECLGG